MPQTTTHFGLIVAYLLPGFVGLAGVAPFLGFVREWLEPSDYATASLGPPIYAILAALTIGLIVSAVRWVLIDHVHEWMGLKPPVWDDRRLDRQLAAFDYLVESHYRYYQFVSNMLVAAVGAYTLNRCMGTASWFGTTSDIGVLVLILILFTASRDALSKYYVRTARLVGQDAETELRGFPMFNGNHHQVEGGRTDNPKGATKPQPKPPAKEPKPVDRKAEIRAKKR